MQCIIRAAYALAASRVDTAEVERRAARKALTECANALAGYQTSHTTGGATWGSVSTISVSRIITDHRDREYPAPAPRECVKCEVCGGPMEDARYANHEELGTCVRFLVAEVKRLAAEAGQ